MFRRTPESLVTPLGLMRKNSGRVGGSNLRFCGLPRRSAFLGWLGYQYVRIVHKMIASLVNRVGVHEVH